MNITRLILGSVAFLLAAVPFNWFRLAITGESTKPMNFGETAIATLICWALAAAIGYAVHVSARGSRKRLLQEQKEFEAAQLAPLTPTFTKSAVLRKGEVAYATAQAGLQELKTVSYRASTSGVSFRVAKGVTLRTGAVRGGPQKGIVTTSTGELVITSKRVIFAGDSKSFSLNLEDLINVTNYSDGIGLNTAKATYNLLIPSRSEVVSIESRLRLVLANQGDEADDQAA